MPLTLKVPVTAIDALRHFETGYGTVRGDGGSRVGEVRAGTTSPSIRVLSYSNCQEIHSRQQTGLAV